MEPEEAIKLISHNSIQSKQKTTWADLGCGSGLFTSALANLLAPNSTIYAIDNNSAALHKVVTSTRVLTKKVKADFTTDDLHLPLLDGILMANSLHFVKDKISLLNQLDKYLRQDGCFLVIEYDMDIANPWVPYPLNYQSLTELFPRAGFTSFTKIHELPSRYNHSNIYSVLVQH